MGDIMLYAKSKKGGFLASQNLTEVFKPERPKQILSGKPAQIEVPKVSNTKIDEYEIIKSEVCNFKLGQIILDKPEYVQKNVINTIRMAKKIRGEKEIGENTEYVISVLFGAGLNKLKRDNEKDINVLKSKRESN